MTLHWLPGNMPQTAGGVVGSSMGGGLQHGLGFLGATLLLIAAWMAGLSLAFHVSWFTVMDRIGAAVWDGVSWLRTRASTKKDVAAGRERKQARKEAAKTEQKKTAARPPPRIEAPQPDRREERARREGAAGSPVRSGARPTSCRRSTCSTIRRRTSLPIPRKPWRRCLAWSR